MWNLVRGLKARGVTIILTTHYIEEAEEMADRVGVINKGALILVEQKETLMKRFGKKQLTLHLKSTLSRVPEELAGWGSSSRPTDRTSCARSMGTAHSIFPRCYGGSATSASKSPIFRRTKLARGYFRELGERAHMSGRLLQFNRYGIWAIYKFEMSRALRTLIQSLVTPVITTSLYFVVFGAAIGSRMTP